MSDDYSAGALYQLWHPMIENAIDSDARCHGLHRVDDGLWYNPDTSTWIDAQGYVWTPSSPRQHEGSLNGWDPKASAMHWAETIPPLWHNWDVLPDPTHLGTPTEAHLGTVYDVISGLAMFPNSAGYAVDGGDADLLSDVTAVQTSVGGMYGASMIAFNHEVSSRLVYTLKAQSETAAVVAFAIQAEQKVWKAARTNLIKTADNAVLAFENATPYGKATTSSGWLKMLGAVADALSLTPIGKVADILKKVGTAAKSSAVFHDAGVEEKAESPLDADSPQAVCEKITEELEKLSHNIAAGEAAIARGCRAALHTAQHGKDYETSRPSLLDDDDPHSVATLAVELPKLRDISVTLGRISTRMNHYGAQLSGVLNPLPWERPGGFGGNPYGDFALLVTQLETLISTSGSRLELAADHMAELAKDFKDTDDDVASGFTTRHAQLGA